MAHRSYRLTDKALAALGDVTAEEDQALTGQGDDTDPALEPFEPGGAA